MKKKLLVIGSGTGGVLTTGQMLEGLDSSWEVHNVYDPKIPILGVGEATSTLTPNALFKGADFILARDAHHLDSTLKFSVKYVNWRKHNFHSYILPSSYAIHFDNTKLKDFAFMRYKELYPNKFISLEGTVSYFKNTESAVEVKINDEIKTYDYVIDCSGFPKDFKGYVLEDLPLNHAIATQIQKPGTFSYTYHLAHKNGWMFGIPLMSRQGWGYMYNSDITSKDEAINDMCNILELDAREQKFREFAFRPYYTLDRLIDGRVLKNGNQFMFFEPMEAMSMEYYTSLNLRYLHMLRGKMNKQQLLQLTKEDVESLVMFYRFMYHGGSTFNSEFWNLAKEKCKYYLKHSSKFNECVEYYNSNKEDILRSGKDLVIAPFDVAIWKRFDRELGYLYFK